MTKSRIRYNGYMHFSYLIIIILFVVKNIKYSMKRKYMVLNMEQSRNLLSKI